MTRDMRLIWHDEPHASWWRDPHHVEPGRMVLRRVVPFAGHRIGNTFGGVAPGVGTAWESWFAGRRVDFGDHDTREEAVARIERKARERGYVVVDAAGLPVPAVCPACGTDLAGRDAGGGGAVAGRRAGG